MFCFKVNLTVSVIYCLKVNEYKLFELIKVLFEIEQIMGLASLAGKWPKNGSFRP